eukprot:2041673-Rhodomonas_salina.5
MAGPITRKVHCPFVHCRISACSGISPIKSLSCRWDERMGEEADPNEPSHFRDPDAAINEHLQPVLFYVLYTIDEVAPAAVLMCPWKSYVLHPQPEEGKLAALHIRGPFGVFDNIREMVSRYKLRELLLCPAVPNCSDVGQTIDGIACKSHHQRVILSYLDSVSAFRLSCRWIQS